MKLKRWWFYLSVILGGVGFVATKLEKKKKLRWGRILWGVILGIMLILGYTVGQVFSNADDFAFQSNSGCAVIFGAAVWKGDQPSWALSDRVEAAIELYENKITNCFILSGGASTYGEHEVDVMKKIIIDRKIPSRAIKSQDYNGINTIATITNLTPKTDPYIFVSNDFHLARIGLVARKKGIKNYQLHAAPYQKGRYIKNDEYFLREMAGYLLMMFGL